MTPELNEAGYLHTKVKLADLLERRARTIPPRISVLFVARRSFAPMIV